MVKLKENKIQYPELHTGEETIPIIDRFAMNCKGISNICIDKNGPSVIINVPEITKLYVIFKSTSRTNEDSYRYNFR